MNAFENVKEPANRLVVGCMNSPRPMSFGKHFDDRLELAFHDGPQVWPRLQKILEIGGAPNQVLASSVHSQQIAALAGSRHSQPMSVVSKFLAGLLREQA